MRPLATAGSSVNDGRLLTLAGAPGIEAGDAELEPREIAEIMNWMSKMWLL